MTINETHRLQFSFTSLRYVFLPSITITTTPLLQPPSQKTWLSLLESSAYTVPECFAEPSSSLVVQPKPQHSRLQTYSLHPSLTRHHTTRCKDKIIPNSLNKKQANKQVNNYVNAVQRIFSIIVPQQCSQSSQLHILGEQVFASWPNNHQRITQCSPEILAQLVRDYSWPVRQKSMHHRCTFLGGRGVVEWQTLPRPRWEI